MLESPLAHPLVAPSSSLQVVTLVSDDALSLGLVVNCLLGWEQVLARHGPL